MHGRQVTSHRTTGTLGIGHSGGTESVAERHREIIREQFAGKTAADN